MTPSSRSKPCRNYPTCRTPPRDPARKHDGYCAVCYYKAKGSSMVVGLHQAMTHPTPTAPLDWQRSTADALPREEQPYQAPIRNPAEVEARAGLSSVEVVKVRRPRLDRRPWETRVYYTYAGAPADPLARADYAVVAEHPTMAEAKEAAAAFVSGRLGTPVDRAEFLFGQANIAPSPYGHRAGMGQAADDARKVALRVAALDVYGVALDDTAYALALVRAHDLHYWDGYEDLVADATDLAVSVDSGAHALVQSMAPTWAGTGEDLVTVANALSAPRQAT